MAAGKAESAESRVQPAKRRSRLGASRAQKALAKGPFELETIVP
jgi:hypothetical protein